MEDIYHQILKEWYWLVIFSSLVGIAFAPSFLKAKCPGCKKRTLATIDLDPQTRATIAEMSHSNQYFTFFTCTTCNRRFLRERSGPFQDASGEQWRQAFTEAEISSLSC